MLQTYKGPFNTASLDDLYGVERKGGYQDGASSNPLLIDQAYKLSEGTINLREGKNIHGDASTTGISYYSK